MTDWVEVPESLLAEAMDLVAEKDALGTIDVPPSLIDALIEYMSEDLTCDHSVNICMCAWRGAVEALQLARDGYTLCNGCGGDGFHWSDKKYNFELETIALERNLRIPETKLWIKAQGLDDTLGYEKCPKCSGEGKVKFRD